MKNWGASLKAACTRVQLPCLRIEVLRSDRQNSTRAHCEEDMTSKVWVHICCSQKLPLERVSALQALQAKLLQGQVWLAHITEPWGRPIAVWESLLLCQAKPNKEERACAARRHVLAIAPSFVIHLSHAKPVGRLAGALNQWPSNVGAGAGACRPLQQ